MRLSSGTSRGIPAGGHSLLTLFAARGTDPGVVDAVETLWRRAKDQLQPGQVIQVPDLVATPEGAALPGPRASSVTVLPVFDGERLVALVYVDGVERDFAGPEIDRLARFSRTLAGASDPEPEAGAWEAAGLETYLERTPVQDIERQKLLLLLERHGWNIARVARLMGITRRTIYLRLRRYNVPRQRVYRSRMPRTASPGRAIPAAVPPGRPLPR
jgi:hypothetical protein